ncbi:MAG: glycolate oxidase iron-sulfur subunit [Planctomycetota bacterium]|jgi:glycolate oxidase iron-sulfur subunit
MEDRAKELLLRYEKSLDCIHCGLCLSACPTYQVTGNEIDGPRGRISLMRALAEGELQIDDGVKEPMELCLLCRACESTCPSAVQFGAMMEITRHEIHTKSKRGFLGRSFEAFMLKRVLPSRRWMSIAATMTRCYTHWGIRKAVHGLGINRILPATLRRMEATVPVVPAKKDRRPLPELTEATTAKRGRVGFLAGCVMPELFGDTNRQTVDALVAQGYDVVVPKSQTCCGALHIHAGDQDSAKKLARQNIESFLTSDVDWIVFNSAGCGAAMAEYAEWFASDPESAQAKKVSAKVIDILELFAREDLTPRGGQDLGPVCYDAPCHLHHAQGCQTGPLAVINRIPDLDVVPLDGFDRCCGAAGIYNLTQPEMSDAILEEKLDDLERSGAKVLLTGNPGCLMQWQKGIAGRGLDVEVRHPVSLL